MWNRWKRGVEHAACAWFFVALLLASRTGAQEAEPLSVLNFEAKFGGIQLMFSPLCPRAYIIFPYTNLFGRGYLEADRDSLRDTSRWVVRRVAGTTLQDIPIEWIDVGTKAGTAYLYLAPYSVEPGDRLWVGVKVRRDDTHRSPVTVWQSKNGLTPDRLRVEVPRPLRLVDAGAAPNQELLDGSRKDSFHFNVLLDGRWLVRLIQGNVYLKGEQLLSTEDTDITTKLEIRMGLETPATGTVYQPWFAEVSLNGNQALTNRSVGIGLGKRWSLRRVPPGTLARMSSIEQSPLFQLGVVGARPLRRDIRRSPSSNDSLFAVKGEFTWRAIRILPDMSVEIVARGWWFPFSEARGGYRVYPTEGYLEVSIPVPIETGRMLRIKYVLGANESNAFRRSSGSFFFGVETGLSL
jgi:hypothetical protein